MSKIRNTIIAAVAIATLGTGSVYAVNINARNSAIGEMNAQNFAFADAGVDPVTAKVERTSFEFEKGEFVYDVEFKADGKEYDYLINSKDGSIVEKKVEKDDSIPITRPKPAETSTAAGNQNLIGLEAAKAKALADAGVSASNAKFLKGHLDLDDGKAVYEIEFYVSTTEYDYEIDAVTGQILSKDVENELHQRPTEPQSKPQPKPTVPATNTTPSQAGSKYIGIDKAKSIALSNANLSASSVTFKKAKQDNEDGRIVYEIEFIYNTTEYEYEIDATTGKILSFDKESIFD